MKKTLEGLADGKERERKILVPASQHSRLNRKVEAKKTHSLSLARKTLIQNFGYDENPELKFVKICRLNLLPIFSSLT